MNPHLETGKKGETLAKEFLISKGYTILHENWRKGSYEIDIIARHQDFVVIAEVKTRSSSGIQEPFMAVNKAKQKSLFQAARIFLESTHMNTELRFDIISIVTSQSENRIEHIEDAFRAYIGNRH